MLEKQKRTKQRRCWMSCMNSNNDDEREGDDEYCADFIELKSDSEDVMDVDDDSKKKKKKKTKKKSSKKKESKSKNKKGSRKRGYSTFNASNTNNANAAKRQRTK
eukprot:312582_1